MIRFWITVYLIASWSLLILGAPLDSLFALDGSDDSVGGIRWNSRPLDPIILGPSDDLLLSDLFSDAGLANSNSIVNLFEDVDGGGTIFANTASQSPCVSQANDDDEYFTLKARDGPNSCLWKEEPIISPKAVQLFQDPTNLLNNLPLETDPDEPSYPGVLSDEEADDKVYSPEKMTWDLGAMGLEETGGFFCPDKRRPLPVCCDGPVVFSGNWHLNIKMCERRESFVFLPFFECRISLG